MSFPKYPAYKESGVEWIGEIPVGWNLLNGRRLFADKKISAQSGDEQLSATQKYGVIPQKDFMKNEDQKVTLAISGIDNFRHVDEGDFVISLRSFQGGIEYSYYKGCVSPAYTVLCRKNKINNIFWIYLFKSRLFIDEINASSEGIRDGKTIRYEQFGKIAFAIPPLPEQQAIASFLDRECGKIDTLIAEQERLIALLAEKRQAVISHAVTKGLNPKAPMKDSGIPWIGMVPEGWEVRKISHDFIAEKGKNGQLLTKEYCSEISGDFPVYSGQTENNGVMASINFYEFDFDNGVIFSTTVGAKAMSLKFLCGKFNLSQNCMIIFPKNNIVPEYSYYAFRPLFDYERSLIPDHMQPSFRISDLYNFSYVMPPFEEQIMILNFIKKQEEKLTSTEREVQRQITLLKERRAALISAAVTGKIDVRAQSKTLAA